jgi:methyl-accepting chemotaxis protein
LPITAQDRQQALVVPSGWGTSVRRQCEPQLCVDAMNITRVIRLFTIRMRMLCAVGIVALALIGVGGVGMGAQFYANQVATSFVTTDFAAMSVIAQLRTTMSALRGHEKDMIIYIENREKIAKSKEAWTQTLEKVKSLAASLSTTVKSDEQRAQVTTAMAKLDAFQGRFLPVIRQLESGGFDTPVAAAGFMARAQGDYDAAQATVEALAGELQRTAQASEKRLRDASMLVMALLGGAVALALVIIAPLTLLNMRSICKPIDEAARLADAIASGDLTAREVDLNGKDEATRLLKALSSMQESLRRIVGQVRLSTDSIGTASTEIASGSADLSSRTEQTASNLQQAASSMEELTGTVKQSADSARQANQLAASAAEVAARGGHVVSQVVSTMDDINASSKKISDIIGVIDGIAFQTNILALNAAVEAARAGEQGRGFAVVASEVRSLAQRSAQAAKEIKGLIGASVEKVDSGSKLVANAGQTMQEIVSSVQRVTDIIGEITAASSEQSDGIGQVNTAVVQLDQMTQQNAALVEQSAAAAESLKEQAMRLAQAVSTFKLDAGVVESQAAPARSAPHSFAPVKPAPAAPAAPARKAPRAAAASAPAGTPPAPAAAPKSEAAPLHTASARAADNDWETF